MRQQEVHQHNTSAVKKAQERASQQLEQQISAFSHKVASRLAQSDHLQAEQQRSAEKRVQERQRAYTYKLQACEDNLRSI